MKAFFVFAVVNNDVETAGHGDEKLMALSQSMAGAISATGNVVKVKDAFDLKWDVAVAFKEREIAARIIDLRQFDDAALA